MNIVLIALDTQRADHLGCYGYAKNTSPVLDSIAARGVLFEKCYAPNIPTHPSFTTMLTGREAIAHDIVNIGGGVPIENGIPMIQEVLQKRGYRTGAVDTMGRHFSRGFDEYLMPEWDRSDPLTLRRAEHVTDLALPLLEKFKAEFKAEEKPFFLFLHYWDPHTPYLPPAEWRTMFYAQNRDPYDLNNHSMEAAWNDEMFKWYFHDWIPGVTDSQYVNALYDAETAYLDWQLRRVFAALEPILDDTLVLITADHGEILDEQLGFYDHHGLYEGNVHVPLILFGANVPKNRRVAGLVQNTDFMPTFLEYSQLDDLKAELKCEGQSLWPLMNGEKTGNYDEVFLSEATWEVKRGLVNTDWKFIHSFERDPHNRAMQELFDLKNDPTEQKNLAEEKPEVVQQLKARLDSWVAKRLQETGRDFDPVVAQGRCGTQIGSPISGEKVGAGATPLYLRAHKVAADIPKPEELNAGGASTPEGTHEAQSNTMTDENTGAPLHGYVEEK